MVRELVYSGCRAGMYCSVRDVINGILHISPTDVPDDHGTSITCKVIAALCTGTCGSLLANPVDVIKVRSMATPSLYRSVWHGLWVVGHTEGIRHGLYKGLMASTIRGACVSAGELATYDHIKSSLRRVGGWEEGGGLHVLSSLATGTCIQNTSRYTSLISSVVWVGVVATTVAAPFDVVKTRCVVSDKCVVLCSRVI